MVIYRSGLLCCPLSLLQFYYSLRALSFGRSSHVPSTATASAPSPPPLRLCHSGLWRRVGDLGASFACAWVHRSRSASIGGQQAGRCLQLRWQARAVQEQPDVGARTQVAEAWVLSSIVRRCPCSSPSDQVWPGLATQRQQRAQTCTRLASCAVGDDDMGALASVTTAAVQVDLPGGAQAPEAAWRSDLVQ